MGSKKNLPTGHTHTHWSGFCRLHKAIIHSTWRFWLFPVPFRSGLVRFLAPASFVFYDVLRPTNKRRVRVFNIAAFFKHKNTSTKLEKRIFLFMAHTFCSARMMSSGSLWLSFRSLKWPNPFARVPVCFEGHYYRTECSLSPGNADSCRTLRASALVLTCKWMQLKQFPADGSDVLITLHKNRYHCSKETARQWTTAGIV